MTQMMWIKFFPCIFLLFIGNSLLKCALAEEEAKKVYFQAPTVPENAFLAAYIEENDLNSKFIVSKAKKDGAEENLARYDGQWKVAVPTSSAIEGDFGLILDSKAKHHAVAIKLDKPLRFDTPSVVIQYEVKFQNGMDCGGSYIKLISKTADQDLSKFYDKTPFTIMFGPDKCGMDGKIHFIFRHQNPISKKIEEKSIKAPFKPDKIFADHMTHLLTLVLHQDNKFEIYLDQSRVNSGSLLEDFEPPVNPPNEIPDPNDKKPADWDDRAKIADPEAKKPDDWDENAPEFITDVNEVKPDGWLDKEEVTIPDPEAKRPDDWDVEIDGEWEAPRVDNPVCKSAPGCGQWKPRQIHNPAYKGKWHAPMIDNPAYKGEWKPRVIPNPDYFEDTQPYKMIEVSALGLELWSMSDGVVFDNFLIVDSKEAADKWAAQTWTLKHKAELQASPSAQSVVDFVRDQMEERPAVVVGIAITSLFFIAIVCYLLCCRSSGPSEQTATARRKKDDDLQAKDDSDADMDRDQKYEAAGPAAMKKPTPIKSSSSSEESASPTRSGTQTNGHAGDETPEEVEVQVKDTKVKRRSRKD